jgi:hypothetical protein
MELKKLTEYLKLIPKGLGNPTQILEGWINDYKLDNNQLSEQDIEKIISRRVICETCPLNSINAKTSKEYKELYGKNYKTSVDYLHCSICSCPIKAKTACLTCHCGLEEYNNENPDNFQNLKW